MDAGLRALSSYVFIQGLQSDTVHEVMIVKARPVQEIIEEVQALPREDQEYILYALSRMLGKPSSLPDRAREAQWHYHQNRCRRGTASDLWSDVYD